MDIKEMDILDIIKIQNELNERVTATSKALNEFESFPNGLVPSRITNTDEYKQANREFKKAFKASRDFNAQLTNVQMRQIRKITRGR